MKESKHKNNNNNNNKNSMKIHYASTVNYVWTNFQKHINSTTEEQH